MAKIVWRVGDAPTGRYKSFENRSWPMASIDKPDGNTIAAIHAANSAGKNYRASIAETTELTVSIMDWSGDRPVWRRLKARPLGVKAAKVLVAEFLKANPSFIPN